MIKQVAPNGAAGTNGLEAMNLEFFYTFTAKDLPGSELGLPWPSIIFTSAATEPTINRAVSALGSLHRALKNSPSESGIDSEVFAAPFEKYHKAIVALRRYIDRAPEVGVAIARETTLVATLLLFCFEVICGNDELALKHLEAGFGILAITHEQQAAHGSQGLATLALSSDHATIGNTLTQVFLRLASDWLVSGYFHYEGTIWPLHAVCRDRMPNHFQSCKDASVHLDVLCSEIAQYDDYVIREAMRSYNSQQMVNGNIDHECAKMCWAFAVSGPAYWNIVSPISEKIRKTMSDLERWRTAFSFLIAADSQSKPNMLLEVQYLQAWFALLMLQDHDLNHGDRLLVSFERVVHIAEKYVHLQAHNSSNEGEIDRSLPHLSQLGNNLASCVSLVIEKCRDSSIRRRGIQVLSSIDMQGIFDMPYLVAYYQHLVSQEEARARALNPAATGALRCEDVPKQARFRETMFCDCESSGEGDGFYKMDHGRMLYVIENDAGVLEAGETWFLVNRKGSSKPRAAAP